MAGNLALLPVDSDDDRLSDLPEYIFEHVLSFLPAEDAVRSSVLSRRWWNAWTRAPVLNLSDEHHHGHRFRHFARAVLSRYGSPENIPSLNVVISRESSLGGRRTSAWLRDAMERVVGSVSVTVTTPGGALGHLVLPCRLRAESISLTMSGSASKHGTLVFPTESYSLGAYLSSSWCPRLRKLRLSKVIFAGLLLVLRMELLEELEMDEVQIVSKLHVVTPNLRALYVRICRNPGDAMLEISAPRLETLRLHNNSQEHLSFLDGGQCVRRLAGLCFYLPAKEFRSITAVRLLKACSEANDISVRIDIPDHCSPSWLSREQLETVPQLPNVRVLSLQVVAVLRLITYPIAPVILSFIRRCPSLRRLHIDLTATHWLSKWDPNYLMVPDDDEARKEEPLPLQPSDSDRLKAQPQRDEMHLATLREINLSGFMGTGQEMEVADLLFGAGTTRPSLERVSISFFPRLIRQGTDGGSVATTPTLEWMSVPPAQLWRHLEGVASGVEARRPKTLRSRIRHECTSTMIVERLEPKTYSLSSLGSFLSSCCPAEEAAALQGERREGDTLAAGAPDGAARGARDGSGRNPYPTKLQVVSPNLRVLDVRYCFYSCSPDNTRVEISAPRLGTVIWHGGYPKHLTFVDGSQRRIRRLAGLCFYLPAKGFRAITTAVRLLEACSEASDVSVRIDIPDHYSTPSWLSREQLDTVPQLPNVRVLSLQVVAVLRLITCPIAPVILSFIKRCPNLGWLHIDLTRTHWFSKSHPNYLMVPLMDDDVARGEEALPLQPLESDRLKMQRDKMCLASLREIRLSGFTGTGQEMEIADLLFGAGAVQPSLERVSISLFPRLIRQGTESVPAATKPTLEWMSAPPAQLWQYLEGVGARVEARFPLAGGCWEETNPGEGFDWTRTKSHSSSSTSLQLHGSGEGGWLT
nr:unnamed protein product [Digitaria exilis]